MPRAASVPPALTHGPFARVDALTSTTPGRLRGGPYRRLPHGVYVADGPLTHGDLLRAARLVLPEDAVLCGRSAAWAHGVEVASHRDPVEAITTSRRGRRQALLTWRSDELDADDVVGTPLGLSTGPARTAFDLAR